MIILIIIVFNIGTRILKITLYESRSEREIRPSLIHYFPSINRHTIFQKINKWTNL